MSNATCDQCGAGFSPTTSRHRFCSKRCGSRHSNKNNSKMCTVSDCAKPHRAKGMCASHYNDANYTREQRYARVSVACPTCGTMSQKRADLIGRNFKASGFCSLACRDAWRVDQPSDPMWSTTGRPKTKSELPRDHPVRVLVRENAARKSPQREAFEAGDWPALIAALERLCVKVDACWLWGRHVDTSGYGRIGLANRQWSTHRLMAHAMTAGDLDRSMAVHHICAETLCINPYHLQVITPQENTAEMLERRYYQERIASLEAALADVAPRHALIISSMR